VYDSLVHHIVEDADAVASRGAGWIADAIRKTVRDKGACALALAGGSTPRQAYRRLPTLPLVPWAQVEVFFGDERAVPPDSPDSNFRMAQETFLSQVPIPAGKIHRMAAERDDLMTAAREYEALLPASLDVLLLGIGPDGHTASLFPHAPALQEREHRVVRVVGGEPLVQRLTITPPVIQHAARTLVLATGAEKAEAVARALEGPDDVGAVPAQLARGGTWILDRAAARLLGGGAGQSLRGGKAPEATPP
jgi:6-phosphogluconolactonase